MRAVVKPDVFVVAVIFHLLIAILSVSLSLSVCVYVCPSLSLFLPSFFPQILFSLLPDCCLIFVKITFWYIVIFSTVAFPSFLHSDIDFACPRVSVFLRCIESFAYNQDFISHSGRGKLFDLRIRICQTFS